jgi:uncharacterized protein
MHLVAIFLSAIISLNDHLLRVELAMTEKEHAQGLMEREHLQEGEGMLFIFDEPHILSFWMKNTNIPLSIAFFDAHRAIINIEQMDPPQGGVLRTYRSHKPALFALEVSQGWFDRQGIRVGDFFEWTESDLIE